MNQPITLNKLAFNLLIANLLEIEERIDEIIADFFIEPSEEAKDVRELIKKYIKRLDDTIPNITLLETADDDFPFVVIGSEVIVKDTNSKLTYCYKLVSPHKNNVGSDEISFISPMGKALLLKKVNDSLVVEAPGGSFRYKILTIRIHTGTKILN